MPCWPKQNGAQLSFGYRRAQIENREIVKVVETRQNPMEPLDRGVADSPTAPGFFQATSALWTDFTTLFKVRYNNN